MRGSERAEGREMRRSFAVDDFGVAAAVGALVVGVYGRTVKRGILGSVLVDVVAEEGVVVRVAVAAVAGIGVDAGAVAVVAEVGCVAFGPPDTGVWVGAVFELGR